MPVEKQEIRHYALLNRNCNPLYLDEDYAKKTRWRGIIAPPSFLSACYRCHVWATCPVEVEGAPSLHWLYAGDEFAFFLPVRPGDLVRPKAKLVDICEKVGRFVGPMVYSRSKVEVTNQHGELIAIHWGSLFRYNLKAAQERRHYKLPEGHQWETPTLTEYKKEKVTARGATPLYYEDVEVGNEIAPLVRTLWVPDIIAQGAAHRAGILPPQEAGGIGCDWHFLPTRAWSVRGLPAPFDIGPRRHEWVSRLMTDWFGDDGWLHKMKVRYNLPIFAGDTTTCKGKVTNKYVKDNQHFVDCEIWFENQRGEISTTATATAILPSRGS
jgi:acyl dehydratase